jgi:hypothetical protein
MDVQQFLNWAGTTGLNFYRSTQGQDPVTSSGGQVTGTAGNQNFMFISMILGLVLVLVLLRK